MIKIGYAGILQHYEPQQKGWLQSAKDLIWTYRPKAVDPSYRSPLPLLHSLALLKEEQLIQNSDVQMHLWGKIDSFYEGFINTLNIDDLVRIGSYRTHQETIQTLMEMDLLFLPLEKSNSKLHRNLFVPSKLFEYIAVGKPILAICEPSEAQEILEESGLGIIIPPENEYELITTIHQLIQDPSLLKKYKRNDHILNHYSAETATRKLACIFNRF
jgi:glycosyltransferase involved in cell wall biosynthesis